MTLREHKQYFNGLFMLSECPYCYCAEFKMGRCVLCDVTFEVRSDLESVRACSVAYLFPVGYLYLFCSPCGYIYFYATLPSLVGRKLERSEGRCGAVEVGGHIGTPPGPRCRKVGVPLFPSLSLSLP